jgi:hypothetical protein
MIAAAILVAAPAFAAPPARTKSARAAKGARTGGTIRQKARRTGGTDRAGDALPRATAAQDDVADATPDYDRLSVQIDSLKAADKSLAEKIESLSKKIPAEVDMSKYAAKADLDAYATKADLDTYATKAELEALRDELDAVKKGQGAALDKVVYVASDIKNPPLSDSSIQSCIVFDFCNWGTSEWRWCYAGATSSKSINYAVQIFNRQEIPAYVDISFDSPEVRYFALCGMEVRREFPGDTNRFMGYRTLSPKVKERQTHSLRTAKDGRFVLFDTTGEKALLIYDYDKKAATIMPSAVPELMPPPTTWKVD